MTERNLAAELKASLASARLASKPPAGHVPESVDDVADGDGNYFEQEPPAPFEPTACDFHATAATVRTMDDARLAAALIMGTTPALIGNYLSMGHAEFCCPAGAHARFLTASALREPVAEPETCCPAYPNCHEPVPGPLVAAPEPEPFDLTACELHNGEMGTVVTAIPLARAIAASGPPVVRALVAHSLSMGHEPWCCPAGAHARFLMASAFRTA